MKVWDVLVRLLHWALVTAIATAWLSTLHLGFGRAHEPAGYMALILVSARLLWGFVGSYYARFAQFVRQPAGVLHYAKLMRNRREPRYIGHNPLGGWMVLVLLTWVAATGLTGWLQTTDRYWGSEPLELVHTLLAWSLLGVITLHVAGVIFTSVRHRENLLAAMFTGNKAPPLNDDVT